MTQRAAGSPEPASVHQTDGPPPDVVAFIRFCHRRRGAGWPELYDEMCAVAARREFKGWDHAQLASRGVTFALQDVPRLAGWVRATVGSEDASAESETHTGAGTARRQPQPAGV